MALLSKSCVYGLRACILIAARPPGEPFMPIGRIAKELRLSFHFLTKILQALTGAGLLRSYRGPSGGVALAKPASKVTLMDLVLVLEGADLFRGCVLGLSGCGDRKPCPMHSAWAVQRKKLAAMFSDLTLQDLARRTTAAGFRLTDLGS